MIGAPTFRRIPQHIAGLLPNLARENANERITALALINRRLASSQLDWHDVARACGETVTTPSPAQPCKAGHPHFGDLARFCRDNDHGRLSQREREFVASMCRLGFKHDPTSRQASWLADIYGRLAKRAAA